MCIDQPFDHFLEKGLKLLAFETLRPWEQTQTTPYIVLATTVML